MMNTMASTIGWRHYRKCHFAHVLTAGCEKRQIEMPPKLKIGAVVLEIDRGNWFFMMIYSQFVDFELMKKNHDF